MEKLDLKCEIAVGGEGDTEAMKRIKETGQG